MKLDYFLKKEKISKIFSYLEVKDGSKILFGWKEVSSLDLNTKLVISRRSVDDSSKKINEVSTLSDYKLFFKATTGLSPEDFLKMWSGKEPDLKNFLQSKKENTLKDEESFWLKMADLIVNEKKFTKFGISYKILNLE